MILYGIEMEPQLLYTLIIQNILDMSDQKKKERANSLQNMHFSTIHNSIIAINWTSLKTEM